VFHAVIKVLGMRNEEMGKKERETAVERKELLCEPSVVIL